MPLQTRIVSAHPAPRTVRTAEGHLLKPPLDWMLIPPGDAALTRRIKAAGPTWTVQERKGRKIFSQGVWAKESIVESIRRDLETERATPQFAKRRQADSQRRERDQGEYVQTFQQSVMQFLAFDARYADLAIKLSAAVTSHATPVGSGTVARTRRITVEQRAEAAVIAWMRHQTTGYDGMTIARIKGKRREVRRQLAEQSKKLLAGYRRGTDIVVSQCPLARALAFTPS